MNNKLFEESKWNYYVSVIPIMLFFISFLTWASLSSVDEVVRGSAKVVPSSQTKVLQNFEGGIVKSIKVQEGDSVKKGQIIYTLSNAFFKADLKTKEIDLLAYKASEIRLKAFINGKEKIKFPKEFIGKIPDIIENEKNIFYEDLQNNKTKISIAKDRLKQKQFKLTEMQTKFENLSIELSLAQANMKIQENLYKKKVVSQKQFINELAKKRSKYNS